MLGNSRFTRFSTIHVTFQVMKPSRLKELTVNYTLMSLWLSLQQKTLMDFSKKITTARGKCSFQPYFLNQMVQLGIFIWAKIYRRTIPSNLTDVFFKPSYILVFNSIKQIISWRSKECFYTEHYSVQHAIPSRTELFGVGYTELNISATSNRWNRPCSRMARVKLGCIMGCPGLKSSYREKRLYIFASPIMYQRYLNKF